MQWERFVCLKYQNYGVEETSKVFMSTAPERWKSYMKISCYSLPGKNRKNGDSR